MHPKRVHLIFFCCFNLPHYSDLLSETESPSAAETAASLSAVAVFFKAEALFLEVLLLVDVLERLEVFV